MDRVRKDSKREKPFLEQMEEALILNEDDLDSALLQQPQLYWQVSRQLAIMISLRDEAKLELTSAMSRADHNIRRSIKSKQESTTEPEIKSRVALDLDVEKANKKLSKLNLECAEWQAMERSFDQRMSALKKLVDLYLKNYWSESGLTGAQDSMKSHNAGLARKEMAEARRRRSD